MMGRPQPGTVAIETGIVTLGAGDDLGQHAGGLPPGDYVTISVSDTGTGMTEDVRAHLFEPFFTTKAHGKGTGLGLATSYGIVKQAGGRIGVYTEPGVGTTMRVYLPVAREAPELAPADAERRRQARGHETVLIVEDEAAVQRIAARILASQGYDVLTTDSAESALQILWGGRRIDLLLTDVVLAGLGGRQLADRARETHRHLKVLFASGYTDDVVLQHQLVAQDVAFLQKPYTADALAAKVREVLDAP